jgi:hypothetical protein
VAARHGPHNAETVGTERESTRKTRRGRQEDRTGENQEGPVQAATSEKIQVRAKAYNGAEALEEIPSEEAMAQFVLLQR